MNTPVKYPLAKLLKEKGFRNPTKDYYFEDGTFKQNSLTGTNGYYGEEYEHEYSEFLEDWNTEWLTKKDGSRCFGCNKGKDYFETYSAPTTSDVIMWLYEKHGIWISGSYYEEENKFVWGIIKFDLGGIDSYNSPTEAYEAAIEYCLNNLV